MADMPEGVRVPDNDAGQLLSWVRDVVITLRGAWTSPRGIAIVAVLDRYVRESRIRFHVVSSATTAVWSDDGFIYAYVEQS